MAILYVTEFISQGVDPNGKAQSSAQQPSLATQTVAISASSAATTNALQNLTTLVRLHWDAATTGMNFRFGTAPTAVANSDPRLAANQTEYFTVPMNSGLKVAGILATV